MTNRLNYAQLDGTAVLFDDHLAFQRIGKRWEPLHMADACCKARLLTKMDFEKMFGSASTEAFPGF